MWLGLILFFTMIFFLTQLWCCFKGNRRWVRLLPLSVAVMLDAVCWMTLLLSKWLILEDSLGFPAAILGVFIFLYWVLGTILAWGIYGIVKLAQKKRK